MDYIKFQLFSNINEEYYKNHSHNKDLKALNPNHSSEEVMNMLKLSKSRLRDLLLDYINYLSSEERSSLTSPFREPITDVYKQSISIMEDYSLKVQTNLPILLDEIIMILSVSNNSCLVGGCVRDILRDKTPKDFDFVTDIPYDKLVELFKAADYKVKETGKEFLVIIVSKDGMDFEIANYRKDGSYNDGRRPESVDIGTLDEDAERRDFTINALYYNLTLEKLVVPIHLSLSDIIEGTLRFIGNPKNRLKEDKLRALRFYRFIGRGFTPHKPHLSYIRQHFKDIIGSITPERARLEIEKMAGLI